MCFIWLARRFEISFCTAGSVYRKEIVLAVAVLVRVEIYPLIKSDANFRRSGRRHP